MDALQELRFHSGIAEKAASGTRIAHPNFILHDAKAAQGGLTIAANNNYGPRPHVLLLADHFLDTLIAVISKGFRGMLQQAGGIAGF